MLIAFVAVLGFAAQSRAQLSSDRLYHGFARPMPIQVVFAPHEGRIAEIHLLAPVTAESVSSARVEPGHADLAELFPFLWDTSSTRLLYAQLVVAGQKIGPALVLQPMITPRVAPEVDRVNRPVFTDPPQRVLSGYRVYTDQDAIIETTKGSLRIRLRPDVAPNTCFNFRHLVEGGYYEGVEFHRVIARNSSGHPFIVQAGDPTGTGIGGPGYHLHLEPSDALPHDYGVVAMARQVTDPSRGRRNPNTAGSQFYIALSREAASPLDGGYTTFGQLIGGADTLAAIAASPVPQDSDRPLDPPVILSARLVDAVPYGEGPPPLLDPTKTAPIR